MGIAISKVVELPMGVIYTERNNAFKSHWTEDFYGFRITRSRSFSVKKLGLESAIALAEAQREYMAKLHAMRLNNKLIAESVPNEISATLPSGIYHSKKGNMIIVKYTEPYRGVNITRHKAFSINRFGYATAVRLATEWSKTYHQPNAFRIKEDQLPVGVSYYKPRAGSAWVYIVTWYETNNQGKRVCKNKSFNTNKYGKEEAKRMAITHRKAMLAINGHR